MTCTTVTSGSGFTSGSDEEVSSSHLFVLLFVVSGKLVQSEIDTVVSSGSSYASVLIASSRAVFVTSLMSVVSGSCGVTSQSLLLSRSQTLFTCDVLTVASGSAGLHD